MSSAHRVSSQVSLLFFLLGSAIAFIGLSVQTGSFAQTSPEPATAAPQFTPAGGTYTQPQSVVIEDATPGAVIYYAFHGVTPTTKSAIYKNPIPVGSTEGIEAIAVAPGFSKSAVAVSRYQIDLPPAAAPTFSPPANVYHTDQEIKLIDLIPGARIYYTTDGSSPTTSSHRFSNPIPVTGHATIRAVAIAPDYSLSPVAEAQYVIRPDVAAPVFHPHGGSYSAALEVRISDSTPDVAIYYTTDGHTPTDKPTPTNNSKLYKGPITIPVSADVQKLKAIAFLPGLPSSPVTTATYVVTPLVATPTFFPSGGEYSGSVSVTLSDATENSTIYYTTNGKPPTTSSKKFTRPIDVGANETINAIAVAGGNLSAVGSASYIIRAGATAAPSFSTISALNGAVLLSLTSSTAGATIYYTLDGSTPTSSSSVYAAPFLVASELMVNAIAVANGQESTVATQSFDTKIAPGTLVWSDEFANSTGANAAPDPRIWTYDTGNSGFGNQELENYCAWGSKMSPCSSTEPNAYVGTDGYLHIVAREPSAGVYTSARLKTQGLFSFRYGRFEVRAKVPEAQGFWPAAWLLGNSIATVNWPACGEMDDLERVNAATTPDWNEGSIHGTGFTGGNVGQIFNFPAGQMAAEWHTYGMIWSEGKVAYYIDDPTRPYVTYTPSSLSGFPGAIWPFDAGPNFIILNLAVGGQWPGAPDNSTPFPSEFVVDYVRIYAN